jgi:hypothetical protein
MQDDLVIISKSWRRVAPSTEASVPDKRTVPVVTVEEHHEFYRRKNPKSQNAEILVV